LDVLVQFDASEKIPSRCVVNAAIWVNVGREWIYRKGTIIYVSKKKFVYQAVKQKEFVGEIYYYKFQVW